MREIKFRAYDKEENLMIYSDSVNYGCHFEVTQDSIVCVMDESYCDKFGNENFKCKIIEETMQYTGLKDKNGKEIYEGDYLKNKRGEIYIVCWNHSLASYVKSRKREDCGTDWESISLHLSYFGNEVIGNIYEGENV